MSQILDAINKAEKQRKDVLESGADTRETLYQSLNQRGHAKPMSRLLPLGLLAIATISGTGYSMYHYHFLEKSKPEKIKINTMSSVDSDHQAVELKKNTVISDTSLASSTTQAVAKDNRQSQQIGANNAQPETIENQSIAILKGKKPPALTALTPVAKKQLVNAQTLSPLTPIKPVEIKQQPKLQQQPKPKNLAAVDKKPNSTKIKASKTAQPTNKAISKPIAKTKSLNYYSSKTTATPSWKKNIRITAIMYHSNPAQRFVLISGKKIYEGGNIPNSQTAVVKIMPKNIIINDGSGDVMVR